MPTSPLVTSSPNAPAASSSLEQTVDVETPEQVVFSYTVAGIGSRAAAAMLDMLILVAISLVLWLLFALAGSEFGVHTATKSGVWVFALMVLVQFAITWGYYVLYEGLSDGQTPGKKQLGLRVVQDGGYSVSFGASAVRNLVRLLDAQPGIVYGVGIISALFTKSGKRLGDIAAGTMVVHERVVHLRSPQRATLDREAGEGHATLLTDDEYGLLDRYVQRRNDLEPERRRVIASQLAQRFAASLPSPEIPEQARLLRLHERERDARARGVAARHDVGAAREQYAIIAEGTARWSDFARRLEEAQKTGLASMSEEQVSDFVARYRELATDLARLRTAARGRELDAMFYLSRLVAGGHNLLYKQRSIVGSTIWRFLGVSVPREIRHSWRPILAAALLMFGPAAISWVGVVRDPALIEQMVPRGMIERAEDGVRRAKTDDGYIPDPELYRPIMSSRIIANNVQVTFQAFAFGMTAGVGTVLALVFNGISFGSIMGLYQTKGILSLIIAFVAPHGVLELSAICIAGGAGLLLASAILLPGALTRREALVVKGRRATKLISASTLFLLVAGTLEGLVSPIPYWPLSLKLLVSAMTAVVMIAYIASGRGTEEAALEEQSAYAALRGAA